MRGKVCRGERDPSKTRHLKAERLTARVHHYAHTVSWTRLFDSQGGHRGSGPSQIASSYDGVTERGVTHRVRSGRH